MWRGVCFAAKGNGGTFNLLLPDHCGGGGGGCSARDVNPGKRPHPLGAMDVCRVGWAEQPQEHTGSASFLLYSAALLPDSACGSERGGKPCFQDFVPFRVL